MEHNLAAKNFFLLIAGQAVSLFGNCILDFALSMYVLEKTGSAALFAAFLSAAMVPTILLSPLGGVVADRGNKAGIMVGLDLLSGLTVLGAALLVGHGQDLPVICATLILLSLLGAFETPTVQACIPQFFQGDALVRGNAVVNQVSALSALAGPFLGAMLYSAVGLGPVMYAGGACFLLTALLECFIRLEHRPLPRSGGLAQTIKADLVESTRFLCRERPAILRVLLLVTLLAFLIQGVCLVGLPFLVRTVLGLSAAHYGALESALAVASIAGSLLAGFLVGRLKTERLYLPLLCIGLFFLPMGLAFLFPAGVGLRYGLLLGTSVVIQISAAVFSIFALSLIQQQTPAEMVGKVMAYTATFSLCAQPAGQILYGLLFDRLRASLYWVFLPTALLILLVSWRSKGLFRSIPTPPQ